jgi:hypothetical protein
MSDKDYDAKSRELEGQTRSFTLRGKTFQTKPVMPGDAFDDLADLQSGKSTNPRIYSALASVIRRTLLADQREAWDELLAADLDVPIEAMTLAEIADDLVSAETGRPTQPLSPSTPTGESTTTPSTGNSASREEQGSTASRSVPV